MRYLHAQRAALGGYLPQARRRPAQAVPVPALAALRAVRRCRPPARRCRTTMAFVRMLGNLLKDTAARARASCPSWPTRRAPSAWPTCSSRSASIPAWASATSPRTSARCCRYREALDGQILEEGISEAGAIASWTAAATSYSVHGFAMLPFYIYYSMFGFQRVGDAIWAAADQRAARLPAGRHLRPHHAGRRGPAAPGRQQPPGGRDHPQLQGLRPGLRRRDGGDRRPRHARDAGRAAGRLLLRHADERELRAAGPAGRRRTTA